VKRHKTHLLFFAWLLACTASVACSDGPVAANVVVDSLEYVAPEEVGFSSVLLEEARAFSREIGSAAVMALHDNKVFVSWGNVETKYLAHSIRKPLLGSLYGIHVAAGEIDTAKTMAQLGIDDYPPSLTEAEKQARVAHLLRSRSGVYHVAAAETQSMAARRPERGSHPPDTYYYYNNWDFNALGTIFTQETGLKIFHAFKLDIADPLGMEDFFSTDGRLYYDREKSIHPAYHVRITARNLARFGLLYLRKGRWSGEQIVPEDWITASTTPHSVLDETLGVGYGMLWGTLTDDFPLYGPGFRHFGYGGHMLLVLPEDELVIVHRADTDARRYVAYQDIRQLAAMIVNARTSN
jgi:CubicO group peptidase (beta-lactamase class C family)